MIRPRARSAPLWGSFACLVGILVSLVGPMIGAQGVELSETGAKAFANIAACAAGANHLLAVIVVDSSSSLKSTDPDDQRVGAIGTALDSLEQLGRAPSAKALDVRASLASFGQRYEELVGWGTVEGDHASRLRASATNDVPSRDRENYTDYREALRGAQTSLNKDAATLDGVSCKVVLWFTDGRLDVDGPGGIGLGPQTDDARRELCSPQGIVDAVRADGIAIVALALFKEGGSVTNQDRERLRAIAEGAGDGEACGTINPPPASATPGAYLRADDPGAMRRLFAQAAVMIEGARPSLSVVCPEGPCSGGRLTIAVDRGIEGFRAILERKSGARVQIIAADGSTTSLVAGATSFGGAALDVTESGELMVVSATFPPSSSAVGSWTLVTDPSVTTLVELYYVWGATLDIAAVDELIVGETGTVRVVPRHTDGTAISTDELASMDVSVSIDGVHRDHRPSAAGGWEVDVDVPKSDVAPSFHVEATAHATTAPSGIALGPITARSELTTSFPPSFPAVAPGRLHLPAIVGDDASTGTLTFTGSERGATKACFAAPAPPKAPDNAGDLTVAPAGGCLTIPANQQVVVKVRVKAEHAADGRVDGVLPVRLYEVDGDEPITVNIPFGLSMTRPVDESIRWGLIALFTFAALALAWVTAEIARRLGDRYVLGTDARAASIPVVATSAGVRRAEADATVLLDPAFDFEPVGMDRKRRLTGFTAAGLEFRRSFGWFPLQAGSAWAEDTNRGIVVAPNGRELMVRPDGSRAPVLFPGSVGFLFVVEPLAATAMEHEEIRGRLVVIVDSPDGVASALPERISDIHEADWDRVVTSVRSASALRAERDARRPSQRAHVADDQNSVVGSESPGPSEQGTSALPRLVDWDVDAPERPPGDQEPTRRRSRSRTKRDDSSNPAPPSPVGEPSTPPTVNFWD